MKTTVYVISPNLSLISDYIRTTDTQTYYIKNKPENDKWHQSLGLCGLCITQLHADTLTADQIEYLSTRIRGAELGQPDPNSHINIWQAKDGVFVSIGDRSFYRRQGDRFEFQRWLDEVLM